MSEPIAAIIKKIEVERDDFVWRCNAAIAALRGRSGEPSQAQHRFTPPVAPRPAHEETEANTKAPRRGGGVRRARKTQEQAAATGEAQPTKLPSLRKMVREAILAQTTRFTKRDIITFVEHRYPAVIKRRINPNRYANEILNIRTEEGLCKIDGSREKGGLNFYLPKAA